jgi:hypothetical protein
VGTNISFLMWADYGLKRTVQATSLMSNYSHISLVVILFAASSLGPSLPAQQHHEPCRLSIRVENSHYADSRYVSPLMPADMPIRMKKAWVVVKKG